MAMASGGWFRRVLAGAAAAGAVWSATAGGAAAQGAQIAYTPVGQQASAPIGWMQFCAQNRAECDIPALRAAHADLDERRWRELLAINARVNAEIEPVTDMDHWGVPELWSYPTDGRGDCEDYVLEKRKRLIAAGWPRQSLLVTVVRDRKGEGHAVLTVKTDRGDFVLDNQEAKVKLWADTGYQFVKRQSQEHPNRWVSLGNVDTNLLTASR
jgi:predicted transglutaminase-like cysteine proteinase